MHSKVEQSTSDSRGDGLTERAPIHSFIHPVRCDAMNDVAKVPDQDQAHAIYPARPLYCHLIFLSAADSFNRDRREYEDIPAKATLVAFSITLLLWPLVASAMMPYRNPVFRMCVFDFAIVTLLPTQRWNHIIIICLRHPVGKVRAALTIQPHVLLSQKSVTHPCL